ncbi:hypothetical protein L0F51_14280 [Afifella sp. H1R]|uniref:hypothetical protein n=1 Tax=Afifella sp. H1R TaxID=2908841 RepID=UPI001F2C9327|nr:hypothetical protein [Afifella sp. H1R]MCF1504917.1 hypothetical protein [Afifella sp. H1R]
MRELLLHIGHPKTGSSTLQAFLARNAEELARRGLFLAGGDLGFDPHNKVSGNPLHYFRANAGIAPEAFADHLRARMATIEAPDARFVLSTEILFNPGHAALFVPLLGEISVRVAYYIRRQDRVLLAAWRQWGLKRGLSLPEFIAYRMNSGLPDYEATITEWGEVAGDNALHLRFLDPRFLTRGDLFADFAEFLKTPAEGLAAVANENVSPDARLLRFLSRHSGLFESLDDDRPINVLAMGRSGDGAEKLKLPKNLFDLVRRRYEVRNQEILARFMPDRTGLAVIDEADAPIEETQASAGAEARDAEHVTARLVDLVSRQERTLQALRTRIEKLEAERAKDPDGSTRG